MGRVSEESPLFKDYAGTIGSTNTEDRGKYKQ